MVERGVGGVSGRSSMRSTVSVHVQQHVKLAFSKAYRAHIDGTPR
jgi:hypothetical protein